MAALDDGGQEVDLFHRRAIEWSFRATPTHDELRGRPERRYSRRPDSASKAWMLAGLGDKVMDEPTAGRTRSFTSTVTVCPATSEMICTCALRR